VSLDRALIRKENERYILKTKSGLRYGIEGQTLNYKATVSVQGKFSDPATIRIEKLYKHTGMSRDIPTYAGILLLVLLWFRDLRVSYRKSAALVFREEFNGVKNYEISRIDRFRYRIRFFTDSGSIGTKDFVSDNYQRFKKVFMSKREKIPRPIAGLEGVYSLKRLNST
jgi:hypothetical protein